MPFSRLVPVAFALALAGCGSIGAVGMSPFGRSQPQQDQTAMGGLPPGSPTDGAVVASAPTDTQAVASEPLPDPNAGAASTDAAAAEPAAPAAGGGGLSRTDLLGGWTISAGGNSCQLFMTLTSWTGGYRASTRGCNNDALKSISAWNLEGRQVILAGTGGAPVARLSSSGNGRFNGTTGAGAAVSFYR